MRNTKEIVIVNNGSIVNMKLETQIPQALEYLSFEIYGSIDGSGDGEKSRPILHLRSQWKVYT